MVTKKQAQDFAYRLRDNRGYLLKSQFKTKSSAIDSARTFNDDQVKGKIRIVKVKRNYKKPLRV